MMNDENGAEHQFQKVVLRTFPENLDAKAGWCALSPHLEVTFPKVDKK